MISAGDIISYLEMCQHEHRSLQRGMNFGRRGAESVILMSRRSNAPYQDRIEEEGRILIYEGHDIPRGKRGPDPKATDQVERLPSGKLTENGQFSDAARQYTEGQRPPLLVGVYEKIQEGIWAYITDCFG